MESFFSYMYDLCIYILMFLYCISIIVASYPGLKISPAMKEWIDRIELSTVKSIANIARLSDEKALKALSHIFFILFMAFFIINIVSTKLIGIENIYLIILMLIFLYFSFSIHAWSKNRKKIILETILTFKKEVIISTKIILGICIVLFILWITIQPVNVNLKYDLEFAMILGIIFIVLFSLIFMFFITNSFKIAFVFFPAVISILYLKLVVSISKVILVLGKNKLNNLFIIYFIVGTLFLFLK